MFLRQMIRKKDGKEHRYFSVVESKRIAGGRVIQRHVLYLGEINDTQELAWRKSIEVFDEGAARPRTLALFPEDRCAGLLPDVSIVRLKLSQIRLCRPRQWGACWLVLTLWRELHLDRFWAKRLPASRKGTRWDQVLFVLAAYRLLDPGSEWRLHREWFERTALPDLLGADFGLAEIHKLYACHDRLLAHKEDLFDHLVGRWRDLFNISFDVLLYDLTSTYFEANPPFPENDKRRHGYSRDHRPDCVQVVIALVVTPEGLPLGYEVMPGNTRDSSTLRGFLARIERQYGKARRIWLMDRGIPTEEVLAEMRASEPPVQYVVGTPKGRLTRLEQELLAKPWQQARPGVEVKLLPQDGELYVFAQSRDRVAKERAMRRRQLKWLWKRLAKIAAMTLTREELLMKLGAARSRAPTAWRLVGIKVPNARNWAKGCMTFSYWLKRDKLRQARRREGRYLLRTNLTENDPAQLWTYYLQLVAVEEAFKNLKGDLAIRPIFHQNEARVEAHIFIAFLAYCLHVTLGRRLHALAPGLTPRSVIEKLSAIQMIDVHVPTTDGRELVLTRYTEPEPDQRLLLSRLRLELPAQPPPKITAELPRSPALL
ncbi:MAG TPA: IS1634 family transposase [Candidatus Binataceae bacterium]|jgi:transposase|nr:IS1634 family transposase [Candidatus Binataceae bacterium]